MIFGNPAGAWGLLGLLAVFAIHALRRRRRSVVVSGLFLFGGAPPPPRGGRWVERVRRSPSLWLQLAAAALVAWLLLEPRPLRLESSQRVVVVLDSSASMSAWRERAERALAAVLPTIEEGAAHSEWVLLESAEGRPTLYAGPSRESLEDGLALWDPVLGAHDLRPALDGARQLAGSEGRVLLLTDSDVETPVGVERVAVGEPLDNVGFAGLAVREEGGEPRWRALVRSYSRRPERRRLSIVAGGQTRPLDVVELGPGELRGLSGGFPPGIDAIELALEPDAFQLEDRLPVVRPERKPLVVALDGRAREDELVSRLLASLDAVVPATADRPPALDIRFGEGGDLETSHTIAFAAIAGDAEPGPITLERHPLVADTSWWGLLLGPGTGLAPAPGEQVLVWSGRRPLVTLRESDGRRLLRLGLSSRDSNAARHPALPLLAHRFAEEARAAARGHERRNLETHQAIDLAFDPGGPPLRRTALGGGAGETLPRGSPRAPDRPGLFEVRQGEETLLTGAARFADVREADLREAVSLQELSPNRAARLRRVTRPDPLAPLWLLLAGALMTADWTLAGRPR